MGPTLLARLMGLNETQEGILTIAFELCDDKDMLLLDMKDLRAVLNFISDNKAEISREYGNVTSQSVAAIQRQLLKLERAGEELPEVGNPEKPKMVFFFDEAHLLFEDAPKALINKIEQVSRLIRSKGVGIYFVTQNPADVPDDVLGQLGNRIQHALRAYTPKEQKSIRAAASSFRENPAFDTEEVITDLAVGEALVSVLDHKGVPGIVGRTMIRPPASRLGPAVAAERSAIIAASPLKDKYTDTIDRESAYEKLEAKSLAREEAAEEAKEKDAAEKKKVEEKKVEKKPAAKKKSRGRKKKSAGDVLAYEAKLIARQLVRSQGRRILRGVLGSLIRR
jgi:DNA helicase HerA-like ATPase